MRAAFITTIASVAVMVTAGGACDATVTVSCLGPTCSSTTGGGGGGDASSCPELVPGPGARCPELGMRCDYPHDDPCEESHIAECGIDGRWNIVAEWVNCSPPACPTSPPVHGAPCKPPVESVCDYEVWFCPVEARCIDGAWNVSGPECNPPPPMACFGLRGAECEAFPTCEWMVPGCGSPKLPEASCHPIGAPPGISCAEHPSLCANGLTCKEVSIDPCVIDPCDACHESVSLCVPVDAPGN